MPLLKRLPSPHRLLRFFYLSFLCWRLAGGDGENDGDANTDGNGNDTGNGNGNGIGIGDSSSWSSSSSSGPSARSGMITMPPPPVTYDCPDFLDRAKNDVGDYFDYYTEFNDGHRTGGGMSDEGFRDRSYGGRDNTYSQMKRKVRSYKLDAFAPNLNSGDLLYESACAEGLNLLMTIEILRENEGIENLTVYGNEYLADSTALANDLFDYVWRHDREMYERGDAKKKKKKKKKRNNSTSSSSSSSSSAPSSPPPYYPWFRKGIICRGDSSNLKGFVPSDTFDLAYTGFLDPLVDPLHRHPSNMTEWDRVLKSRRLCKADVDSKRGRLLQREQRAQEDWHAAWTSELLRIVKPGKVVIIEDVGPPVCHPDSEWGGVDEDWWYKAAKRYKWDVDPDTIETKWGAWYKNRYNVFMRRRNREEEEEDDEL